MMKRRRRKIPSAYSKWIDTILILLILFTFYSGLTSGDIKIVGIFIDPNLDGGEQLFDASLVADIVGMYEKKGYEVWKRKGTAETIIDILIHEDMKEIVYIGRNPQDSLSETAIKMPTLAGLTRKEWQEVIRTEFEKELIENDTPPDQAKQMAEAKSQNLGIEKVSNYSSYSLANTTIADLFVKPGGKYYGAMMKYTESDLAMLFQTPDAGLTEYHRLESTGEIPDTESVPEPQVTDTETSNDNVPDQQAADSEISNNNVPDPQAAESDKPERLVFNFNVNELQNGPSWGSGPPDEGTNKAIFDLFRKPGEASIACYPDKDVIWQWTGEWKRLLRITEGAILEYDRSDLNNPIARYERDVDEYGHYSEVVQQGNRPKWSGIRTDLQNNEKLAWSLIWR